MIDRPPLCCDRALRSALRATVLPLVLALAGAPPAALAGPAAAGGAKPAAATGDSALAVYDGGVVYPHDFVKAWWMLSPPQRPPGDALTSRRKFLESVVDRQLVAQAARSRPLTLTPDEEQELARTRDQVLENALFQELTKDVPEPTGEEVERYRKQLGSLAEIRFVTFKDWDTARSWKRRLAIGTPLSQLDAALRREGARLGSADTFRFVAAEQIPDTVATLVWSLRPGGASDILDLAGQPTIIVVRSFLRRPNSKAEQNSALKLDLQRKRYDRLRERVRQEMAARTKRTFDEANLQLVLAAYLKLRPRNDVDSVTGRPLIRPNLPLPQLPPEDSSLVLARTAQTTVTIGDYLRYWGTVLPYARPEIRELGSLEGAVDRLALAPALIEEARARGLDKDPAGQEVIENTREGYAVDHFYHDQFEAKVQVTEAALRKLWAADPAHYNDRASLIPRLLVVDRKSLADSLLSRLKDGASFPDLASQYSTAPEASQNGGLEGKMYRGSQENAGLEAAMFATPTGQLGGPEQTPQGWVVWRVESSDPGLVRSFEDARWMVERDFRIMEADRLLTEWLDGVKKQKHLVVYEDRVTPTLGAGGPWD